MKPVYPKDNGSLDRAREAFRKKVANWKWDDETEECSYKRRGLISHRYWRRQR